MGRHLGPARTGRLRLAALPAPRLLFAALAVALCTACSGGDTPAPPTPAVTVLETNVPPAPEAARASDPAVTVENAVQACREKNDTMLRGFVAGDVPDAEIEALFARGTDVLLTGRSVPEIDGDSATVEVMLEIHRDTEIEDVQRSWQLDRGDDGVWRFPELPDCY